jgi:hypothetical protein
MQQIKELTKKQTTKEYHGIFDLLKNKDMTQQLIYTLFDCKTGIEQT